MEFWRKKRIAIDNALYEMGISLWDSYYDLEEGEAPFNKYVDLPLLIYTGLICEDNYSGPDEATRPIGDFFLINSITKHFLSKKDPLLEKVAWNTFFPTISYEGSYLKELLFERAWKLEGNSYTSYFYNRTKDIITNRLTISPFTQENIVLSEEWSYLKEYRKDQGPIFVLPQPFSPSFGHTRISFQVTKKGEKEAIGAIILDKIKEG